MNWQPLTSTEQVDRIRELSSETPCLIFKHSTACPISGIAMDRLERDWDFSENEMAAFYLDLRQFRPVSKFVAEAFEVRHESPQALIIAGGECVFDVSHLDISVGELREAMAGAA